MSAFPADFPARPPSEVEWEELLVRLEITPRALRLAVEDAGGDSPGLRAALAEVAGREAWWGDRLEELREGRPIGTEAAFGPVGTDADDATAGELVERFTRLREHNFARVQRRGLGVWEWESRVEGEDRTLTAYQALQLMARSDGVALAALRRTGR